MTAEKICICGTHGVGKTTLVNEIEKLVRYRWPNSGLIVAPEMARETIDTLRLDWRTTDIEEAVYFQRMLHNYYCLVSRLPGPLLSDRCALDSLQYARLKRVPLLPGEEMEAIQAACRYTRIYLYRGPEDMTEEQRYIEDRIALALFEAWPRISFNEFSREDVSAVKREIFHLLSGE